MSLVKTATFLFQFLSLSCTLIAVWPLQAYAADNESSKIEVARFTDSGRLIFPSDLDQWVFLGASAGRGYSDEDFDPNNPGTIQIVSMEPTAYIYFKKNKKFANGSMFFMSLNKPLMKTTPEHSGFAQGNLITAEIHLIDKKYDDGRAFFRFRNNAQQAPPLNPGNECVQCHLEHGDFDGVFTQFYPTIRHLITDTK